MSLIKEKNHILAIAAENNSDKTFPCISATQNSYYLPYQSSKHMECDTMIYNSDLVVLRKEIDAMWKDFSNIVYSKDILSAMYQCKDDESGLLEAIDLYNYMM